MRIKANGNVGIGTSVPQTKLQVEGSGFFKSDTGALPAAAGPGVRIFYDAGIAPPRGNIYAYDYGAGTARDLILQQNGGSLLVGPITPKAGYQIVSQGSVWVGGDMYLYGGPDAAKINFWGQGSIRGGESSMNQAMRFVSGRGGGAGVNIFTWYRGNDPPLDANRLMLLEGDGYLWTLRGSLNDIAEYIPVSNLTIEAGDVVAIDSDNNETIKKSSKPYQTAVIGVISTNPAQIYGNKEVFGGESNDKKRLLCIAGRVPVKVTDENGPIKRGDLLTSSSKAGYAMKASPVIVSGIEIYRPGTIIGKAMEPLEKGEGKIIVFVDLM